MPGECRWRIRLLGIPALEGPGGYWTRLRPLEAGLLAVLAIRGRSRLDELAALAWEHLPRRTARARLRRHLAGLARFPGLLRLSRDEVELEDTAIADLDRPRPLPDEPEAWEWGHLDPELRMAIPDFLRRSSPGLARWLDSRAAIRRSAWEPEELAVREGPRCAGSTVYGYPAGTGADRERDSEPPVGERPRGSRPN